MERCPKWLVPSKLPAMKRIDLRGVAVLVALANWTGEAWSRLLQDIGEALRLGAVKNLQDDRVLARHMRDLGLTDAVAALLAGTPLLERLAARRVGKSSLERLARVAERFLGLALRGASGGFRPNSEPELDAALRRPLTHRFILPVWAREGLSERSEAKIAGWGSWHPVLTSPDDLLTWAMTNVLETGSVGNVGLCVECRRYYLSERRGRHRFCSSQCRDSHWNRETGAERTRRSRGQRAARGQDTQDHIQRGRRFRPRSRGGRE